MGWKATRETPPGTPWSREGLSGTIPLMPTFVLYYPEKEKRWQVELQGQQFLIGRTREAGVCIPHTSVSKKHVLVEKKGPRFVYRDLGSKNGVYLNGFRMDQGALDDGDELRVGSLLITFYREKAPRPAASAAPKPAASATPRPTASAAPRPAGPSPDGTETPAAPAPVQTMAREAATPVRAEEGAPALSMADLERELSGGGSDFEAGSTIRLPLADGFPRPEEPWSGELPEGCAGSGTKEWRSERIAVETRPTPPSHRRWPRSAILLGAAGCVALGLLLGYVGGRMDLKSKEKTSPEKATASDEETDAGGDGIRAAPSPAVAATPPIGPLGPPAALNDLETAQRLYVRLFLDHAGRPPLHDELKELASLPLEQAWYRISSMAPPSPEPPAEKLGEVFERFMGRRPRPEEHAKVLEMARGDPAHYAFTVGTSRGYASASHRRKRPEGLLARSLLVDLTGTTPSREHETKTLEAVRLARDDVAPVAKAIVETAGRSQLGPREGEKPEGWVREAYSRMLLRFPTEAEREAAAARMAERAEGWRAVLLDLASRKEYLKY